MRGPGAVFKLSKCLSVLPCNYAKLLCITEGSQNKLGGEISTNSPFDFPILALVQVIKLLYVLGIQLSRYLSLSFSLFFFSLCGTRGENLAWQMTYCFRWSQDQQNLRVAKHSSNITVRFIHHSNTTVILQSPSSSGVCYRGDTPPPPTKMYPQRLSFPFSCISYWGTGRCSFDHKAKPRHLLPTACT